MTTAPVTYTTSIPVTRTVGEIMALVSQHGGQRVAVEYGASREPIGLVFQTSTPDGGGTDLFAMPVNVQAMQGLLERARRGNTRVKTTPEQAARVAWRVVLTWLRAQFALIDAQQATLQQVMLPYLVLDESTGVTLFDVYTEGGGQPLRALA